MRALNATTKVTDRICLIVSYFSMAVAAFLCIILFADVVLRKVSLLGSFNFTVKGAYEMCQVGLSMFVFSSWAYVQTIHGHIHVVMFVQKMPQKMRFICFGFCSLLSVVTMCFASYGLWGKIFEVIASGEKTSTLQIPFWPFYIFEFVAFVLLAVVLLLDALKSIIAIFNKEMADQIQKDWV